MTAALFLGQAADEHAIQVLIDRCGSAEAPAREAALRALIGMGASALPLLEARHESLKGEAKRCVVRAIHELRTPEQWATRFVEEDTDGHDKGLEDALRRKEITREKATAVLRAMVLHKSGKSSHRHFAVLAAYRFRLADFWTAAFEVLERDDPAESGVVGALRRVRLPPKAATDLLRTIPKVRGYDAKARLLDVARLSKADRVELERCLSAILETEDFDCIASTIKYAQPPLSLKFLLGCWRNRRTPLAIDLRPHLLLARPDEALPDLVKLLDSDDPDEVLLAIDYIGRHRVASAAGPLAAAAEKSADLRARALKAFESLSYSDTARAWIADDSGPGRLKSIALVADLGWKDAEPQLLDCLKSADPAVRREAAVATGRLRIAAAAAPLEALLKDDSGPVRRAALSSLGRIRGREATEAVLGGLASDDPDLREAALGALPLVDADVAVARLTGTEALIRPATRRALAILIRHGGAAMLHRVVARSQGGIDAEDLLAELDSIRRQN